MKKKALKMTLIALCLGAAGCASQPSSEMSEVELSWEGQLVKTLNEAHAHIKATWVESESDIKRNHQGDSHDSNAHSAQ